MGTDIRHSMINTRQKQALLLEERAVRVARKSFLAFYLYQYPKFTASWHHKAICRAYQALVDGDGQRLAISMPPGHAKSFLTNLFCAWQLGRDPSTRIIISSYSDRLVRRNCKAIRDIIETPSFQRVFPGVTIDKTDTLTSKEFHIAGRAGYLLAEPAGGQITGFRADLLVVDDPYKGMKQARSNTYNSDIKEWYDATFRSRGHSDTKELVIHTRWTMDDLIGWLMAREGDSWSNIVLPALKEGLSHEYHEDPRQEGEALWPAMVDLETLKERQRLNPSIFYALYQQKPAPPGGEIIKNKWTEHRYQTLPPSFDRVIQSWDLRNGGKGSNTSYAVGQLWGKLGPDVYLIDQVRDRWDFPQTLNVMTKKLEHPVWSTASAILIEDKADGRTAIPILKQKFSGITPVNPTGSKEERLSATSAYWAAGNVILPEYAHYLSIFVDEVTRFPGAANDDQIDAATQAINELLGSNDFFFLPG